MKGNLIIISSPSGGGKGTLIKEVRGTLPDLGYSCSHTTRPKRFGEEEDVSWLRAGVGEHALRVNSAHDRQAEDRFFALDGVTADDGDTSLIRDGRRAREDVAQHRGR